jgi:hypothetical protein
MTIAKAGLSALAWVAFVWFSASSCGLVDEYPRCPTAFEGEDAQNELDSLRKSLLIYGIYFFNNKIFVSTSGAILEFSDEHLSHVYKCRRSGSDWFEPVGADRVSQEIWFYRSRSFDLLNFDGTKWGLRELPQLPKPQYYSREDANVGFEGFNYRGKFMIVNPSRFTLRNIDRAWTLEQDGIWTPFHLQAFGCEMENPSRSAENGCLKKIAPIEDELCAVLHGNTTGKAYAEGRTVHEDLVPETDIIACLGQNSWRVLNPHRSSGFISDKVVARDGVMYATTRPGEIFHITTSGPKPIETLGKIEALTITSKGTPLVWFSNQGIYEFTGSWNKLYDPPNEAGLKIEGKLMEEHDGTLVVVGSQAWDPNMQNWLPDLMWILTEGRVVRIL